MKRLFLTVVAVLGMTTTFAENENVNGMNNSSAYDMSINIRRLGGVLGLTFDQMESVTEIHRDFCGEMMMASQAHKDDRKAIMDEAVEKDLKYMSYILTPVQFDKYKMLLNATLSNRGLK